jgi:hypothetical protein
MAKRINFNPLSGKFDFTETPTASPVDSVNGQTGVVVLDTDDIDDTASNRYTDDTDIARLANTSGTNTGDQDLSGKQDTLVSGTNIKTINSTSLLGSGNIAISAGSSLIIDTKRNILTSTPADPSVALASDTNEYYAYDGTNWNKASLPLSETSANPDIGPMRNNDKLGYNDNSITDNNIANLVLEGSSRTEDGGIRIDHSSSPVKAQIYYNEAWHEFIAFDALPALTHTQKNTQMYATIGNSLLTDASGNPLVQQYAMSIGPLAAKLELDGGTF